MRSASNAGGITRRQPGRPGGTPRGAGVSAQQLANDPGREFSEGRFAPLIEPALDMYEAYFAPDGAGLG